MSLPCVVLCAGLLLADAARAQPASSPDEARLLEIASLGERSVDEATALAQRWLQQATAAGDADAEAYARIAAAALARRSGQYDRAAVELVQARDAALRSGIATLTARSYAELGITYALARLDSEALIALREAHTRYLALRDWRRASGVLSNIGNVLGEAGDVEASRLHYQQALAMKREHGIAQGIGGIHNNLADLAAEAGDFDTAAAELGLAVAANRQDDSKDSLSLSLINLADTEASRGRFEMARAHLAEADALIDRGARRLVAFAASTRARLLLKEAEAASGDARPALLQQALQHQQEAARLTVAMDDPDRSARVARLGSDIHAARGEWREALQLRDQAEAQRAELEQRFNRDRYQVLAAQYANERQQREVVELRERESAQSGQLLRQQLLIALVASLALGLAALTAVLWRQGRERRRQQQRLQAHNQALSLALKEAEEMRQRAQRFAALNTRLLQLAGDDLRAPALRIRSLAERWLVERSDDSELCRQGVVIASAANEVLRSSEQMIESGLAPSGPAQAALPIDVAELLADLVVESEARLVAQGRRLQLQVDQRPCLAAVDGARLQLLLHELVQLVLALPAKPAQVQLRVRRVDGEIEVQVDDPDRGVWRQLGDHDDADGASLGMLWIQGALRALGGRLSFVGPPLCERSQVQIRVPAAGDAQGEAGGEQQQGA